MRNIPHVVGKHPREQQAAWLKILLSEQLTSAKEIYLYGSMSKIIIGELAEQLQTFDEDSDYDFAVQDSAEVYQELISLGWTKKDELSYQDAQTEHIFEGELDGERVQISLRRDLEKFKEAWRSVDPEFYWRFLNKRSPTFLGREGVQKYLDQLFWLLIGTWRTASSAKKNAYKGNWLDVAWEDYAIELPQPRWVEVAV